MKESLGYGVAIFGPCVIGLLVSGATASALWGFLAFVGSALISAFIAWGIN